MSSTKLMQLCAASVQKTLKLLLETKHLYQPASVEPPTTETLAGSGDAGNLPSLQSAAEKSYLQQHLNSVLASGLHGPWRLWEETPNSPRSSWLEIKPPHVRLFCTTCRQLFPFNAQKAAAVVPPLGVVGDEVRPTDTFVEDGFVLQVFTMAYMCQGCQRLPEIFLLRREGLKITLSGRTPIEQVDRPRFIPKIVGHWYSGAVVAFQSGQELAGLFLLRTVLEQFARTITGSRAKHGGEVIEEYMRTLPDAVKGAFPSPAAIYEKLSIAIHTADPLACPFEKVRSDLDLHFEARELHTRTK